MENDNTLSGGIFMSCRIADLRSKEVISVKDGGRLGYVCDVELDTQTAAITALVVYGRPRLLGVLVKCPVPQREPGLFARLWAKLGF